MVSTNCATVERCMLGAAVIVAALPEYNSIQPFLQGQIRIALSGMRKASGNCRSRFRPVLHRSVPLHLLLGSKGAGGGKRTRYPVQGHPHHGQRIRAERSRAGHDLCAVPGRQVFDAGHSVRQKISGAGGSPGLSRRTSESRRFMCGYAELIPAPGDPPRSFSSSPPSAARRRGRCTRHRR